MDDSLDIYALEYIWNEMYKMKSSESNQNLKNPTT